MFPIFLPNGKMIDVDNSEDQQQIYNEMMNCDKMMIDQTQTYFILLDWGDSTPQQMKVEMSLEEAISAAREELIGWADGETPTVFLYDAYNDEKYGCQPATHLDYIWKG